MKRNYGIDLLKILAMLMVVAHHILMAMPNYGLGHGLLDDSLIQAFHVFCYCAVDSFVMATGFVMCQKDWRASRIVRIWGQVVGYSVALNLLAVLFFPSIHLGFRDWAKAFMPITFNSYWFVTQYVALFFTIPYLNKLLGALDLRNHLKLSLTGLCILSLSTIWAGRDLYLTKWGYSYVWFLYLYLIGALVHRLGSESRLPRKSVGAGICFSGIVLSVFAELVSKYLTSHWGVGGRFGELMWSYASPTVLLEAVGMIVIFAQAELKNAVFKKMIQLATPSTFVVYIVQSNDTFRNMVRWSDLFVPLQNLHWSGLIVGCLLSAIAIFGFVLLVDLIRRWIYGNLFTLLKGARESLCRRA